MAKRIQSSMPFTMVRRPDYTGHARGIKSVLTQALIDTSSDGSAVRVLLNDDPMPAVRRRVTALASRYGYSVRTRDEGDALVAWFEAKKGRRRTGKAAS